jgi:hypothetical protein
MKSKMKKALTILVPVLALAVAGYGENGGPDPSQSPPLVSVDVGNHIATNQNQNQSQNSSASASGGDSKSDSKSNSSANISTSTTSVTNYQARTPPLTTFPPYLPYWNHGGWGTIKAYFPNGPSPNDQIYETTFDPKNPDDQHELRSVLKAVPHKGLLQAVGAVFNDMGVALFGKPDTYFHGRGIEIADSIVRDRRPDGKALLVFIDSNVDMNLLGEEGYAYVGRVSVEADPERNWDQGYKAAVAEALLWDVDILLVAGGMKGVTTGTNVTFPSAAAGYSQVNYSLSLLGGKATGITEGKGKATLSAEAYRYSPRTIERRRIPAAIYDRIRFRAPPAAAYDAAPAPPRPETSEPARREYSGPATDLGRQEAAPAPVATATPASAPAAVSALGSGSAATSASVPACAPARRTEPKRAAYHGPGITMSRELFELAGFPNDQQVGYVNIR